MLLGLVVRLYRYISAVGLSSAMSIYDVSCVSKTFFAADGEKVVERCTIKNYTPYPSHYIYVQPFSCQRKQSKRCNTAQSLRGAGSGTQPPACAGRQCLLQAHPSRIDGTSLFYIRISGLRIRQNGASLVFLFAPMIFLLAGLSLVLWCFLGRPLEPWTVVDRMVDSAMCGARCRSQPVTGRRDA